jgi:WD40 repeat protein
VKVIPGQPHTGYFAFRGDGQFMVTLRQNESRTDGFLTLWDTSTGREVWNVSLQESLGYPVEFSPKGTLITASGYDKKVAFKAATGERAFQIDVGSGSSSLLFSPDEMRFLCEIGSDQPTSSMALFDSVTGERRGVISSRPKDDTGVFAFSPDGGRIFGQGPGDSVDVWEAVTGERIGSMQGVREVSFLAFSPDGSRMVSNYGDVWDITSPEGNQIVQLGSRFQDTKCLDISKDGNWAISSGDERGTFHAISVWNTKTGEVIWAKEGIAGNGDMSGITARFSPDGSRIVSLDANGGVNLWETSTGIVLKSLTGSSKGRQIAGFSADSTKLVVAGTKGAIAIYAAADGAELQSFRENESEIDCVALSPDQESVASIRVDGILEQWKSSSGEKILSTRAFEKFSSLCALRFLPDGTKLVARNWDGEIVCLDLTSGEQLWKLRAQMSNENDLCMSPDGVWLAIAELGQIHLIDVGTGKELRTFGEAGVGDLAFSPDSARLASSNQIDYAVTLWNPATGEELRALDGPRTGIECVAFSENGESLIAAGRNSAQTWSAKKRYRTFYLVGHSSPVKSSAINRDGTRVVSCSDDGTVKFWDLATAQALWTRQVNLDEVAFVAFDPDEQRIVVASKSQQVFLLSIENGNPLPADATLNVVESELVLHNKDWQKDHSGNEVYLTDLSFNQRPETQEIIKRKMAMVPTWHYQQAENAAAAQNWYAATFHYAWLAKAKPDNTDIRQKLAAAKERFAALCDYRKVDGEQLMPSIVQEVQSPSSN